MHENGNNFSEFSGFRFDTVERTLWQNGSPLPVPPKALDLLALLIEKRGHFVSKQEIFERVWPDTFVEDGVLTQNIYTLRKVLGEPLIENRIRRGYRITVAVTGGQPEVAKPAGPSMGVKIVIAIAALVLLVFTVSFVFFLRDPQPEAAIVDLSFRKVTDTGNIQFAVLSRDGDLAAYRRANEIYLKDLRTAVESKVNIYGIESQGFIQFSRDGESLYVTGAASVYKPSKLIRASRYGGEGTVVAGNVWSNFSLSPNENRIAFMRRFLAEGRQALFVKDLASGEESELLSLSQPQQFGLAYFPAWSPDGSRLAVTVQLQPSEFLKVVIVDTHSGTAEDLELKEFEGVEQIAWLSHRNGLLAIARKRKNFQIWEIGLADKKAKPVTNDVNDYNSLSISADGSKIMTLQRTFFANIWLVDEADPAVGKQLTFGTSNLAGWNGLDTFADGDVVYSLNEGDSVNIDLARVDAETGKQQKLTEGAGSQNRNPSVSPDGRYVYFSSNRGGRAHIWRIEADGKAPTQMTFSESGTEMFVQISPDGEHLYFIRKDKTSSAVWRKSLTTGEETKITDETQFSPSNILELSPDGRFIGFQNLTEQSDADAPGQKAKIVVIEIAEPANVRTFEQGGAKTEIHWTLSSTAFDYIFPLGNKDEIRRTELTGGSTDATVMEFAKERIFNISRSPNGKSIAVSRGQRQHDAILLNNFR